MPKVSVIIPVYNTEKYLRECLDSVVNQTLRDIEIICVDDGSTDNSLNILKEYAAKDDRFVILEQKNQGPAIAREYGVNNASGEYVGFVDADDFIDKNYYNLLYKNAKRYDSDIAMTDNVLLYDNKVIRKKKCGVSSNARVIKANNEKANIIITTGICWNKIYKKTFIDKYNLRPLGSYPGADNIFNAITVIRSDQISIIHNAKYYYVQLDDSIVHKLKDKQSFSIFNNYKYIDEWIESQEDFSLAEKHYWQYVNSKRKKGDYKVFYNTMAEEFKEEFSELADVNLKIKDLIVSLTSYPARINTVNQTIESLLNQTVKPEKIILWLAPEQFPNKEKDLPPQLLDLVTKGLTIDWYKDIKSYKKLIPALQRYPNRVIVTVDDDVIYEPTCLEKLYNEYLHNPSLVHCNRAHRITFNENGQIMPYNEWERNLKKSAPSYNNFFTGVGGVLYPPNCFNKDILREDLFMELCPQADDIWFWAMLIVNNRKINVIRNNFTKFHHIEGSQKNALWYSNMLENKNIKQLNKVVEYYPEIMNILDKDSRFYSNIFEQIFSIKSCNEKKVITLFKIKVKLKNKKKILENRLLRIESRLARLEEIDKNVVREQILERI